MAGVVRRLGRMLPTWVSIAWWGLVSPRVSERAPLVVHQAIVRREGEVLLTVRKARMRALRSPPYATYVDADQVVLEIERARRHFRAHGWKTVDITGRAVEENASRILEMYEADPPGPED